MFSDTNLPLRPLNLWIALATSSLPTPLSPVMSTGLSSSAMVSMYLNFTSICWLFVTISEKASGFFTASERRGRSGASVGSSTGGAGDCWARWNKR